MARSFNLTAELNLRGPANIRNVVGDIRRQLGNITVDITPRINQAAIRNVTALNGNLGQLNATLNATATSANNAAAAVQNLSRAVASIRGTNINQTINNAANSVQTLTTNANNASAGLQQASTRMEEFGRQSALAVRRFAAFSIVTSTIYGFINAVNKGISAFIEFDKEFVRLQQVTDSSAKDLKTLANEITRLSTGLGVASTDLTTVSVTLAQAGLSAKETRIALQALARSALAPSFDNLNDTVEGSIALMRQFGIGAGDLESALGSVNAVAAKFAVEASDLIVAIQRTGGVFAAASRGVSEGKDALNEFLAVFTSIRQTTRESAETIATGLRTIFTRIQRQSTIDALQGLGIQLRDVNGQFVGAYEAVRLLSQGLNKLDPRSREFAAISEELGGFRQIGKVIPLIQQFAVAQQALKTAQEGQGSLAADAATAQLSLANQIAKVREEFLALIRSIGESDSFRSFVRLSLDLASALIKLADSAKTVLPALTAIAAFKGISALTQFGRGFTRGMGGTTRGYATGGYVPGTGNRDTVPAMLTPGEFVIRKKAVQTIGVSNLQNINKYGGGGRIKRYRNGGMADAPMVDDITQTSGSILPKPSAVEALIRSGGGAVDIDRTLKRTLGDKAYAKAATPAAQQQVLGKYFADDMARLQDIKSAPLTAFGKALQEAIKSGQLKGSRVSIISKSRRTKGVPEYLSQLFGIPVANMVFTQGGTKQPAIDAIRAKGPRVGRVAQKFAMGGIVEDFRTNPQGLRLGAAIMAIDKKEPPRNKIIDTQKLFNALGATDFLIRGTKQSVFGGIPKLGTEEIYQGLSENTNKIFQDSINSNIVKGVNNATAQIASKLGLPQAKISPKSSKNFLAGINKGTRGNLFEEVLFNLNNANARLIQKRDAPDDPFDFPFFNNQILGGQGEYTNLPNKWVDAKSTLIRATRSGGLTKKAQNQLRKELNSPEFIKVQTAAQAKGGKSIGAQQQVRTENLRAGQITRLLAEKKIQKLGGNTGKYLTLQPLGPEDLAEEKKRKRKALGGSISGQDTVPALLTPGEFVINKKAAARIGASRLHSLNRADKIQGYNKGGVVQRFSNGRDVQARFETASRVQPQLTKELGMKGFAVVDQAMQQFPNSINNFRKATDSFGSALMSSDPKILAAQTKALAKALLKGKTEAEAFDAALAAGQAATRRYSSSAEKTAKRIDAEQAGLTQAPKPVGSSRPLVGGVSEQRTTGSVARSGNQVASFAVSVDDAEKRLKAHFRPEIAAKALNVFKLTLHKSGGNLTAMQAAMNMATKATQQQAANSTAFSRTMSSLSQAAATSMPTFAAAGKSIAAAATSFGKLAIGANGLQRLLPTFMQKGGIQGAATKAQASQGGGMGGGMMGMVATMAGGMVVDSLSKSLGGETTSGGRAVASMGSNMLNYGAMGAMIGSAIPVLGTAFGGLAGAAIGLTVGFFEAQKAGEEYAQSQRKAAAEQAYERAGEQIGRYGTAVKSKDVDFDSSRRQAIYALEDVFKEEAEVSSNVERKTAGFFGGPTEQTYDISYTRRVAETEKEGAKKAQEFISIEMERTGKTFSELSQSMDPVLLEKLMTNIAEADAEYISSRNLYAELIKQAQENGETERVAQLEKEYGESLSQQRQRIAELVTAQDNARIQLERLSQENAKLSMAVTSATMSLQTAFDRIGQVLNSAAFETSSRLTDAAEIFSGQVSLTSNSFDKLNNILNNPEAYSPEVVRQSMSEGTNFLGEAGQRITRVSSFARTATEKATQAAISDQSSNKGKAQVLDTIRRELTKEINATFGQGSALATSAIADMEAKLNEQADKTGDFVDVTKIMQEITEPLHKISDQASKLGSTAIKTLSDNLKALGDVVQQASKLQDQQNKRTASLVAMQSRSKLSEAEALGFSTSFQQRQTARNAGTISELGMSPGTDLNTANIIARRQDLIQRQSEAKMDLERASERVRTAPPQETAEAAREVAFFQSQLARVNSQLEKTDNALENLPQSLEESIGDIMGEMQKRVAMLESRKQAGAGFAEKLITSTPKELVELNNTYSLLNNTLQGNITTINQSQGAQKAYFEALRNGKSRQEAMADAQSTFADESKRALSMFNELSQVAGLQGADMDRMRADLIENFARASGQGNNRMIQMAVRQLRMDPGQRAAQDPQLQALQAQAAALRAEQVKAVEEANRIDRNKQAELLTRVVEEIIRQLTGIQIKVDVQGISQAVEEQVPAQRRQNGGLIYANKGTLVNFKPKGTDTVPAMLTPGEFVVNRKATQNNIGLLKAINSGNYAAGGMVASRTPTLDQNVVDRTTQKFGQQLNYIGDTVKNINGNTEYTRKEFDKTIKQNQSFSSGGVVYASQGKLINFQPKGTDTVPAMLTPGEFVVNRKATKNNLGLLKSINNGAKGYSKGGVAYLQGGGLVDTIAQKNLNDIISQFQSYKQNNIGFYKDSRSTGLGVLDRNGAVMFDPHKIRDFDPLLEATLLDKKAPKYLGKKRTERERNAQAPNGNALYLSSTQMDVIANKLIARQQLITQQALRGNEKARGKSIVEAVLSEYIKFPSIFELSNPKAFISETELLGTINQQKINEWLQSLDTDDKKTSAYTAMADRFDYADRVLENNTNGLNAIRDMKTSNPQQKRKIDGAKRIMMFQEMASNLETQLLDKYLNVPSFNGIARRGAPRFQEILFNPEDIPRSPLEIFGKPFNRGGVVYANQGQLINFQSKGTDTVPAMLTPGEFVVNRKATQKNLPLLQSINSGNYANGGVVYLANGSDSPLMNQAKEQEKLDALKRQRKQLADAREQEMARRAQAYQQEMARRRNIASNPQQIAPAPAPVQQNNRDVVAQNAAGGGFALNLGNDVKEFMVSFGAKIEDFRKHIGNFGKYVENLASIKLPEKIDFNLNAAPIEVRITGSAVLESMNEGIQKMVASEINKEMNRIWGQTDGEIGTRPK